MAILENEGWCPTCAGRTVFRAEEPWLREHYRCLNCGSLPRERALMVVIEARFPGWRELVVHESSPVDRGVSARLARECPRYVPSQFFPGATCGAVVDGVRCENLEALTFADGSVDLHVTQDVMEHLFHPERAFRELARTLRPGGAHLFTVPIVNRAQPSRRRARRAADGRVEHLEEAVYHGNPVDDGGSLVTVDWGYDICGHIHDACGLFTHVVQIDDPGRGICGELLDVLVTWKPDPGQVPVFEG